MLLPKRTKHRKQMRGRRKGIASRGSKLNFGTIGLQVLEPASITSAQIEAARRCISRLVRKDGKLWICIFPDLPVTQKPAETRQGGGKGNLEFWVAKVRPGRVIFEIAGVDEDAAREALRKASDKLPCKTRIIEASHMYAA